MERDLELEPPCHAMPYTDRQANRAGNESHAKTFVKGSKAKLILFHITILSPLPSTSDLGLYAVTVGHFLFPAHVASQRLCGSSILRRARLACRRYKGGRELLLGRAIEKM